MSIHVKALAATAAVVVCIASFGASAAPVAGALALKNAAPGNVETVRWGGGWRGGGWRGRGWGWGVGAGFATGAIIGGALAAPYYYGYPYPYYGGYYQAPAYYGPPVYAPPPGGDAVAYCAQRFRSYDPRTGTYLGNDGARHPCP
jgi:hypothetical protein